MFTVIRIIVLEHEGGNVVEAFHDASFVVKIGESKGTGDTGHAVFLAECNDGIYQRLGNFFVVNEIYPAETDLCMIPVAVGDMVDDGCDASHQLAVFVCQELAGKRVLVHGILPGIQRGHFVRIQVGDIIWAVFVQFEGELDKLLEFRSGFDRFNFY